MPGSRRFDLEFLRFAHRTRVSIGTAAIVTGLWLIYEGRPGLGYVMIVLGTWDL